MARKSARAPLNIFLNNRHVGRLTRQSSGAIDFAYDPDWLAWEHAIPVSLSLPLRETRFLGDKVTAVFENLLPIQNLSEPGLQSALEPRELTHSASLAK